MRYRTTGLKDGVALVLYHGGSYQNASNAWEEARWASERIIERHMNGEWRVIVGGYQL